MTRSSDATSTDPGGWLGKDGAHKRRSTLALVIAWSFEEPARVGQVALVDAERSVVGRGADSPDERQKLIFGALRPVGSRAPSALTSKSLSRDALSLTKKGDKLQVARTGKAQLRVNGRVVESAAVAPGDVVAIERRLVLLVVDVPDAFYSQRGGSVAFAFGEPDANGIVGECVETWRLRDELDLAGRRDGHVLLVGPSGVGKELAARAMHRASRRCDRPFVARNVATVPSTLFDAEVFGHAKNYPNAGMPERGGLVGEAEQGTLFLDEIGELPHELQAHLLRFLDQGEYHRLGDGEPRRANVRVIAATNRDETELKPDVLARFPVRVSVPGLDARKQDIPLVVRHLLREIARRDDVVRDRFVDQESGFVRVDPLLMEALLMHELTTHVRELSLILSTAIAEATDDYLALGPRTRARITLPESEPGEAEVRDALARTKGNVSRAATELGLPSRDVLYRLMRQHGIKVERA